MCGICGVAHSSRSASERQHVAAMQRRLFHRGPDSAGRFDCDSASLAVRRLAIIDLETGDQPVSNEDGTVQVMQNGEIYNYKELAQELKNRGHTFKTRSDTEVIVHGYEEYGTGVFDKLKGMFAIAIYDQRQRELVLARDRFGEKPLFYYLGCGGSNGAAKIVFSSELQSLLEHPDVPREMCFEALGCYLRLGFVPAPATMFKNVLQLPPGNWLRWSAGQCQRVRYWRPGYVPDPALSDIEVAAEEVRRALTTAVRRQLTSDVEVGALLSGGVDSGAIVASVQALSDKPLKTFTVRFDESGYDESQGARAVAKHLGTDHHETTVANLGFCEDDLWRVVEHAGVPFADSSAIPTYRIAREVSKNVKVCLTGDGGDEIFAGYGIFAWVLRSAWTMSLPKPLLVGASRAARAFAGMRGLGDSRIGRRAVRYAGVATTPVSNRLIETGGLAFFSQAELSRLATDPAIAETLDGELARSYGRLPDEAEEWSPMRRYMYVHLMRDLPEDMLTKVDRMSMAASVETRAPMLDPDLVELSMKLPDEVLVKGNTKKRVLREAVRPALPKSVLSQPKLGFSLPLHAFRNRAFFEMADELLAKTDGPLSVLNPRAVQRTKKRAVAWRRDDGARSAHRVNHQLWALMLLAAWGERFNVSV